MPLVSRPIGTWVSRRSRSNRRGAGVPAGVVAGRAWRRGRCAAGATGRAAATGAGILRAGSRAGRRWRERLVVFAERDLEALGDGLLAGESVDEVGGPAEELAQEGGEIGEQVRRLRRRR